MPGSAATQGPMTSFVPAFPRSPGSATQSPATGLTSCTPIGPPDSCQTWLAAPFTQRTSRSGVPGAVLPPAGARHLPPELIAPSGSTIQDCCAERLHCRSVTVPTGSEAPRRLLAQFPAIPDVSGPAGSVHCWLALGVFALPVAFGLAWQTAATARTPFRVPVSARHRPLLRFFSTAFEPSCHRWPLVHEIIARAAGAVELAAFVAARHSPPVRTVPSGAIVHRSPTAGPQVSIAMLVALRSARHLPSRYSRICPVGPLPLALAIRHGNEVVASAVPELSVTCTWTVLELLLAGHPEMIPQLLMLRPRGSPVAENRRVQPDRPSVARTANRTGVATEPLWLLTAARPTAEWTYQLKLCVACSAPSVAVTDTGNEAADPGSVPVTSPLDGSAVEEPICRPADWRPVAE